LRDSRRNGCHGIEKAQAEPLGAFLIPLRSVAHLGNGLWMKAQQLSTQLAAHQGNRVQTIYGLHGAGPDLDESALHLCRPRALKFIGVEIRIIIETLEQSQGKSRAFAVW
jgi:hypothetical protein